MWDESEHKHVLQSPTSLLCGPVQDRYTYNETLGNFTFLAKGCTNADLR